MRPLHPALVSALAGSLGLLLSSSLLAQRTFVSAQYGNDANPCSVSLPCRTFGAAITAVAAGGEVVVLDSGGYGPFTVSKAVSVEAPSGVYAGISALSGNAIHVSAGSSDVVVLRGLTIYGLGSSSNGIKFTSGLTLHVERCVIENFFNQGVEANAPSSSTYVKDTISRQNGYGVIFNQGQGSVDHSRFEGNNIAGVSVDGANVTVRDSVSATNGVSGFDAESLGSEDTVLNVYNSVSTGNGADGFYTFKGGTGSVTARVANSSFCENLTYGFAQTSGVTFDSLGNNFVVGNPGGNVSGTITIVSGH
jgi:hypothetical protein